MHVEATTDLPPGEILNRLRRSGAETGRAPAAQALRCELEREPPKVFLPLAAPSFEPAAELHVAPGERGSRVILRLMWGPLPAPFPRAVAAVGLALGALLLALLPFSLPSALAAAVSAGAPAAALGLQRRGEHQLQVRLAELLESGGWTARPHERRAARPARAA